MTTYRRYRANYPFDARDDSEVTIVPGETLLVSKNAQGVWPSQDKWMHGRNEETNMEGDFPGNFVEFVEEFTTRAPETNHQKKLPPLPPFPGKPSTPSRSGDRGGVQVLPFSPSVTPPPHSATSPTHRSMGHSSSQGSIGTTYQPDNDVEGGSPPPPPPRLSGRRGVSGSQLQGPGVVENHHSSQQEERVITPPPVLGPPKPKPRGRKLSEIPQHNWKAVMYQIPVECNACEFDNV